MESLFLKRPSQDATLLNRTQAVLDDWAKKIHFSPIKQFTKQTRLISLTEHAAYRTVVTTQLEKRWLAEHEEPYAGRLSTTTFWNRSGFDLWKQQFIRFADFLPHADSVKIFESRNIYACRGCQATGRITCPSCSGIGEVQCSSCSGYGFNKCRHCCGAGQLRKTRSVPRQVNCFWCSGPGRRECSSCHGRGTVIKDFEEEYYIPCGYCAASGKHPCSTCRTTGIVTCSSCRGRREITCTRCEGKKWLCSYVSVERTEEPVTGWQQLIPEGLPEFSGKDSPLSNLAGEQVFLQDESARVESFAFDGEAAAPVLSAAVEACRKTHEGRILRQRIVVERCAIIEYRYCFSRQEYSIYVNPLHGLVQDTSGPIKQRLDRLTRQARAMIGIVGVSMVLFGLTSLCVGPRDGSFWSFCSIIAFSLLLGLLWFRSRLPGAPSRIDPASQSGKATAPAVRGSITIVLGISVGFIGLSVLLRGVNILLGIDPSRRFDFAAVFLVVGLGLLWASVRLLRAPNQRDGLEAASQAGKASVQSARGCITTGSGLLLTVVGALLLLVGICGLFVELGKGGFGLGLAAFLLVIGSSLLWFGVRLLRPLILK